MLILMLSICELKQPLMKFVPSTGLVKASKQRDLLSRIESIVKMLMPSLVLDLHQIYLDIDSVLNLHLQMWV